MAKQDFFDSPTAPVANDLTPVVQVAVFDAARRLLLIKRSDNGYWSLPGGFMEVGERFADSALRELSEETGLNAEITGLVGLYSDPRHVTAFDDGTVHQQCAVCFAARALPGEPRPTHEAAEVGFFDAATAAELFVHPTMRMRIEHAFAATGPHLG